MVLFPHPLDPTRAIFWPARTSKLIPRRIGISLKITVAQEKEKKTYFLEG